MVRWVEMVILEAEVAGDSDNQNYSGGCNSISYFKIRNESPNIFYVFFCLLPLLTRKTKLIINFKSLLLTQCTNQNLLLQ